MALATVHSIGVVLLLMICCALLLPLFLGFCVCSLCCCAVFGVLFSLASHGERERERSWLLYFNCILDVMWLLVFPISS